MQHDFENIRRGAVIQDAGKTRVTMFLDNDVIEFFRTMATRKGRGYQTEINAALRGLMREEEGAPARDNAAIGDLRMRLDEMLGRLGRLEERAGLAALAESAFEYSLPKPRAHVLRDSGAKRAGKAPKATKRGSGKKKAK